MSLEDRVAIDSPGGMGRNVGLSLVTPVCDICGAVLADQKRHDEWHELHDDWSTPNNSIPGGGEFHPDKDVSPTSGEGQAASIILPLPEDAIARMFGKAKDFMERIQIRAKNESWPDSTKTEIENVQRVLKLQMPVIDVTN